MFPTAVDPCGHCWWEICISTCTKETNKKQYKQNMFTSNHLAKKTNNNTMFLLSIKWLSLKPFFGGGVIFVILQHNNMHFPKSSLKFGTGKILQAGRNHQMSPNTLVLKTSFSSLISLSMSISEMSTSLVLDVDSHSSGGGMRCGIPLVLSSAPAKQSHLSPLIPRSALLVGFQGLKYLSVKQQSCHFLSMLVCCFSTTKP